MPMYHCILIFIMTWTEIYLNEWRVCYGLWVCIQEYTLNEPFTRNSEKSKQILLKISLDLFIAHRIPMTLSRSGSEFLYKFFKVHCLLFYSHILSSLSHRQLSHFFTYFILAWSDQFLSKKAKAQLEFHLAMVVKDNNKGFIEEESQGKSPSFIGHSEECGHQGWIKEWST